MTAVVAICGNCSSFSHCWPTPFTVFVWQLTSLFATTTQHHCPIANQRKINEFMSLSTCRVTPSYWTNTNMRGILVFLSKFCRLPSIYHLCQSKKLLWANNSDLQSSHHLCFHWYKQIPGIPIVQIMVAPLLQQSHLVQQNHQQFHWQTKLRTKMGKRSSNSSFSVIPFFTLVSHRLKVSLGDMNHQPLLTGKSRANPASNCCRSACRSFMLPNGSN